MNVPFYNFHDVKLMRKYTSLSGTELLLQIVISVVKLVSKDVCPLRWLQRFFPDCIRTRVEKRIIRLRKDSAAWRYWTGALPSVVMPSRHPRILNNLPDLHRNLKKERKESNGSFKDYKQNFKNKILSYFLVSTSHFLFVYWIVLYSLLYKGYCNDKTENLNHCYNTFTYFQMVVFRRSKVGKKMRLQMCIFEFFFYINGLCGCSSDSSKCPINPVNKTVLRVFHNHVTQVRLSRAGLTVLGQQVNAALFHSAKFPFLWNLGFALSIVPKTN